MIMKWVKACVHTTQRHFCAVRVPCVFFFLKLCLPRVCWVRVMGGQSLGA